MGVAGQLRKPGQEDTTKDPPGTPGHPEMDGLYVHVPQAL